MRKITCLLLGCMLFVLSGCGENSPKEPLGIGEAGAIVIYEPGENQVITRDKAYQLKYPDSVSKAIEEVMSELNDRLGLNIVSYSLEEDYNLKLYANVKDGSSKEKNLLSKASLVRTLKQLDGIGTIQIIINDSEGNEVESITYDENSFYYFD